MAGAFVPGMLTVHMILEPGIAKEGLHTPL